MDDKYLKEIANELKLIRKALESTPKVEQQDSLEEQLNHIRNTRPPY